MSQKESFAFGCGVSVIIQFHRICHTESVFALRYSYESVSHAQQHPMSGCVGFTKLALYHVDQVDEKIKFTEMQCTGGIYNTVY